MKRFFKEKFANQTRKLIIRELSEEIITHKNEFGYDTIAETITTVGAAYSFAKELKHPAPIYGM